MRLAKILHPILSNPKRTFLLFFSIAVIPRFLILKFIPLDWNSDSYHHWQISYLTLKIGLGQGRLWDLNGCECYWGVVPHIVQALLLGVLSTSSITPYRILNTLLGGVNTYIVYLIGRDNFYWEIGFYAAILFALYPVAIVFDTIAMQETLALFFALASIYLFRTYPGWSGVLLALAGQSRTEYWLLSIVFVLGVALIDRFSIKIQPFVVSWLMTTGAFCALFWKWTSNPVYPLYWSLFNVFGGWTERGLGRPFHDLMITWLTEKVRAWSVKVTGQAILVSMIIFLGTFYHLLRRRWRKYHIVFFFLIVLVVYSPIFVTYYPDYFRSLLFMLRMSIPIAGFGSILLMYALYRARLRLIGGRLRRLPIELLLISLSIASFGQLIPVYSRFQEDTSLAFTAADRAFSHYDGGTIVCDHPTMNYRLVSRWGVAATDLLGNHYSPHYYGVTDPVRYAEWFLRNNVTLWLYTGSRSYPVWAVTSKGVPDLLVLKEIIHDVQVYEVDQTVLEAFFTRLRS
jgi:hypothetical protein